MQTASSELVEWLDNVAFSGDAVADQDLSAQIEMLQTCSPAAVSTIPELLTHYASPIPPQLLSAIFLNGNKDQCRSTKNHDELKVLAAMHKGNLAAYLLAAFTGEVHSISPIM
ncbi:hypothetical protein AX16_008351 [Volvariella volvacea WC 439]|nr:hypothetical protein AX16_008351 [Volvariella volvacea WC 439]